MWKLINGLLAALCFVVLASDVLAATHELELKRAFGAPRRYKVGLAQAISMAESRAGGHALDAHLLQHAGGTDWQVEVLSRGRHVLVSVNARSGAVDVDDQRGSR
jgi:uncharacterized membrane protein YkoI